MSEKLVFWFKDVNKEDAGIVGEKGATLGEITKEGFPIPPGFIIPVNAYFTFIKENFLREKINEIIQETDFSEPFSLKKSSEEITKLILQGKISDKLTKEVFKSYKLLGGIMHDCLVTVESSTVANDIYETQQEIFLNVKGEANVLLKIKEVWATLFKERAILRRHNKNYDHFKAGVAILVQKTILPEKSGVMFTIDTHKNDKAKIVIKAIYGLGEIIIQEKISTDHYEVSKKTLSLLSKNISKQTSKLVKKGIESKKAKVHEKEAKLQKITNKDIIKLAEIGKRLETHYYFPQEIKWAIEKGKIYILQIKPVTSIKNEQEKSEEIQARINSLILIGNPVSPGIAFGLTKILSKVEEINKVMLGNILVISAMNHEFMPAIKKAAGVIICKGEKENYMPISLREMGIPAVIAVENVNDILKDGMVITVNGTNGEVYRGDLHSLSKKEEILTATKIYINFEESESLENIAERQVDGIGFLQAKTMLAKSDLNSRKVNRNLLIAKLTDGLEKFCLALNPRPVIYRISDFKTFEHEESNFNLNYAEIHNSQLFFAELEAIKIIKNKKGLKNLWIMLPSIGRVEELITVKKLIHDFGITRSPSLKLWIMAEFPSNIVIIDKFIETGIDGVAIEAKNLTSLLLGTAKNNASGYLENEAVLWAYERVIKTCQRYHITSSLYLNEAITHQLLEKVVKWGITNVSIPIKEFDKARKIIAETEKKLLH